MALIAMAVYCTEENRKDPYLVKCLNSLQKTVDFTKHRMALSVNGATEVTKKIIDEHSDMFYKVVFNPMNLGTAEAVNIIWADRKSGEHAVKMDDDVVINTKDWLDDMEEVVRRNPEIGQVGLKRKDCWEHPGHENLEYRSQLLMTTHLPGERWIVVEACKHVMGTCVLHSTKLLDRVGFMFQPTLYGHDDVLMSWRSHLAGFTNVHIPHIDIDHIDPGGTNYQRWKDDEAGRNGRRVSNIVDEYKAKTRSLYYEPQAERV